MYPLPDLDDALEDPSGNPNDTDGDGAVDSDVIRCCVYVETDHDTEWSCTALRWCSRARTITLAFQLTAAVPITKLEIHYDREQLTAYINGPL